MNIIGVEPRLSMLEAEVEQLETGGGGGECLWKTSGAQQIEPKNPVGVKVDLGLSAAAGSKILSAEPPSDAKPEGVPSWGDFSSSHFQLSSASPPKIETKPGGESLWEPDGTSTTIITPKNHKDITIRYRDAPSTVYASLSSVGLSVNGSKPRNLSGTSFPLSTSYPDRDVPAWGDFDHNDFQLAETHPTPSTTVNLIQLKPKPQPPAAPIPRYFEPVNEAGTADITDLINATPLNYPTDGQSLCIMFSDNISPGYAGAAECYDKITYHITLHWEHEYKAGEIVQEHFTWTYNETDTDSFGVSYADLPHGHFIELMKKPYEVRRFMHAEGFAMKCAGAYAVY
jgi:hypothetical protein